MMARAQARTLARIERPTAEMLLQPRPPLPLWGINTFTCLESMLIPTFHFSSDGPE